MINQLLRHIQESDAAEVKALIPEMITSGRQARAVHEAIFPLAQMVLNPPFINPHLPKMYRIYREFLPYLTEADVPALVRLEITEYTQRPKLAAQPKGVRWDLTVAFPDIQAAIRDNDRHKVVALMDAFREQRGAAELARNLLILGSGYLPNSLGHSLSCTAFILLEVMERADIDPWPAIDRLAYYFCQGQFHTKPEQPEKGALPSERALNYYTLKAASGSGIVNLHHTITRFAIERVRHLLNETEYANMLDCWIEFMGDKDIETPPSISDRETVPDYDTFYQLFSKRDEAPVLACLAGMLSSKGNRQRIGNYLVKGVCDFYQGDYDPHFLTGLGSALWVVNQYWNQPRIALSALRQYVNYFFTQRVY